MDHKDYYTALGQLVYAVAMADGSIQTEERTRLFYFVISEIVELHKEGGHGEDALLVFNIEKEFHRLKDENVPMKWAYENFIEFLENNKNDLDEKMKVTCLNAMEKIASAYNGIEDSEQVLIDKIMKKIGEI
nr:hypothetical protein [Bacteroidota bacterium]